MVCLSLVFVDDFASGKDCFSIFRSGSVSQIAFFHLPLFINVFVSGILVFVVIFISHEDVL
jgi:hypothetical protein